MLAVIKSNERSLLFTSSVSRFGVNSSTVNVSLSVLRNLAMTHWISCESKR